MRTSVAALGRLKRLAKLKSDIEMRRFSAYRAHVEATRSRIAGIEDDLAHLWQGPDPMTLAQSRLINNLTAEQLRALSREESQLQKMLPGFEAARASAAKEFGRAEVVGQLQAKLRAELAASRTKKDG